MAYVPVISTMENGRVKGGRNTYGAPILKTGVGAVNATIEGTRLASDWSTWKDENNQPCAIYEAAIKIDGIVPDYASIGYQPYMYRIWRLCDDIRGYQIVDGNCVNDITVDRSNDLLATWIISSNPSETLAEDGLTFGALADADVKFLVRFYYIKQGEISTDDQPKYYVVDTLIDNIRWSETTTGINEIIAPVAKTYVNAQGLTSNKPFDGLNIVITHNSDGSIKSSKIVK